MVSHITSFAVSGALLMIFLEFFACGWIVIFCGWIGKNDQSLWRKEWHGIDRVVQFLFGHGPRFEMCGIHPCCGWVAEIRLKVFELACDGKFVVAVEDEDVGHKEL